MVRAVKSKVVRSLAKGQRALLLPGFTGAEPWQLWVFGGKTPAEMVQIYSNPIDNRLRKNTTLALPVAQVFCLPLWLNEKETKQFAGMIPLQLELRGLQPRGAEPTVFDYSVVAQEESRTLVVVGVLPATLPPEMQVEAYDDFDLSARYYSFEENTLTLWKEQDRLAVAITRGKNLVYFQALVEAQITQRVLQDLNCTQATLLMHEVITPLQKVVLWTDISPAEMALLRAVFPLPTSQEDCPAPVPPSPAWKLTPGTVNAARRARANQLWQRRALLIFLVIYLVVVTVLVARLFLTTSKLADLRKWKTDHEQAVALVHQGRAEWSELAPVVDTKNYPLELLNEAAQSIPTDQLHLTLFESGSGHLLIKGEAKNVAGAFQFFDKLKSDPVFTSYGLNMGNPRPLPNDLAQFQIEGNHAPTN